MKKQIVFFYSKQNFAQQKTASVSINNYLKQFVTPTHIHYTCVACEESMPTQRSHMSHTPYLRLDQRVFKLRHFHHHGLPASVWLKRSLGVNRRGATCRYSLVTPQKAKSARLVQVNAKTEPPRWLLN